MRSLAPLFSLLCLAGCSLLAEDDPAVGDLLLGRPGTVREYLTVERQVVPGTDEPFFVVPESLRGRVSFTEQELAAGVIEINRSAEMVRVATETTQPTWVLDSLIGDQREYRSVLTENRRRVLDTELANLKLNPHYQVEENLSFSDEIWRETDGAVSLVWLGQRGQEFVRLRKPLQVGEDWSVYDWRQSNGTIYRSECARVTGMDTVTVQAGRFTAFRVEVGSCYPPDGRFSLSYVEHYTPGVGLVLRERESTLYYQDIPADSDGRRHAYVYLRHELVRYEMR